MKKKISKHLLTFIFSMAFMTAANLFAVPVFNVPAARIQPNGDTLHCLLSGDEYYHRLHDANGFTIVQNPQTGFWVYADTIHTERNHWTVVATNLIPGVDNPDAAGISPNLGIDKSEWLKRGHRFDIPKQYQLNTNAKTSGRNHGTLNNIVIFIRFSDESEISTPLSTINTMFNDSSDNATSMYNYFKTVSYNKIHIPTHFYPTPNGNNIISFQDTLPRAYYMPYDSTTNTMGYSNDDERRNREFGLLQRAVNYVNTNSPVSSSLNLDMDNDNMVDNICFVVKGTFTGWSDLLWPHKWAIYDRYVYLNGKRVYTFNLQLEGSGDHYFSSSTFCHEMFHTLGAPDLYRYNVNTNVTGVGSWDLMCSNTTPPQTMSAYMKWKYGNWIDSIPQITVPGTYSLHSLGDNDYSNIAYKIQAGHPNQWYVLEYRDNTEFLETTLPGKGLIIYRIDDRFDGNANFDGVSQFDEVYLFRPGASNDTTNGYPAQAFFSVLANRTEFSQTSDPRPWLTNNIIDTTISITAIGIPGETISFTYNDLRGCMAPENLRTDSIGANATKVRWTGHASSYIIQYRADEFGSPTLTTTSSTNYCTLSGLDINTNYMWRVKSVCDDGESNYSFWHNFKSSTCTELQNTAIGTEGSVDFTIPLHTHSAYSYTQTIYLASDIGQPMNIERIAYNYADNIPLNYKYNVVIYLGLTDKEGFANSTTSAMVPFNQLHKVYEGPIDCSEGWNELQLDSTFVYDGFSNLVVAIDDNSGQTTMQGGNFYCSQTAGRNSTIVCSHNSNINPANSSITALKSLKQFAADIRFGGCPLENTVAIHLNIDGNGSVSGSGLYHIGDNCTISATPGEHWYFSHWSDNAGQTITDNPYTFTADSNRVFTAHFLSEQYHISVDYAGICGYVWFQEWTPQGLIDISYQEGTFDYGTLLYIYADENPDCDSVRCSFSHWNDGETNAQRLITLTQDTSFTAYYNCGNEVIDINNHDGIIVTTTNSTVLVNGATGRHIELFDITGRLLTQTTGTGVDTLALPAKGIYILRIEGLTAKKIVNN